MNQLQQIPKPWMQNWVSTCDVEVWQPVHTVRHIHNVVEGLSEILPLGFANFMITIGKDIAMPTTLVALVGNMPLKCKILFHNHKNLRAKDRIISDNLFIFAYQIKHICYGHHFYRRTVRF